MDEKIVVSNEELEQEQKALAEVKEDEVRAEVIAEFGFDEVDDAERIEKAVARELAHKKDLSQAIGQKIKQRTEKEEALKKIPPVEVKGTPKSLEDVSSLIAEQLEKRDLEALEYPDELKKEISRIAKAQNTNIKKALSDPYIQFKVAEHEKAQKAEEAAISRTKKTGGATSFSVESPPEADMTTEEGRKAWDEYKKWLSQQPGFTA